MGTLRYYLDADENEQELSDHEGYVLAELSKPTKYAPDGWTSGGGREEAKLATGRHRAACECGWQGPIVDTGVADTVVDDDLHDDLLVPWQNHTEEMIPLDALRTAQQALSAATITVGAAVRQARRDGLSWALIGDALGMTKQGAQQRYGG